jgi:hypothetical protein
LTGHIAVTVEDLRTGGEARIVVVKGPVVYRSRAIEVHIKPQMFNILRIPYHHACGWRNLRDAVCRSKAGRPGIVVKLSLKASFHSLWYCTVTDTVATSDACN